MMLSMSFEQDSEISWVFIGVNVPELAVRMTVVESLRK